MHWKSGLTNRTKINCNLLCLLVLTVKIISPIFFICLPNVLRKPNLSPAYISFEKSSWTAILTTTSQYNKHAFHCFFQVASSTFHVFAYASVCKGANSVFFNWLLSNCHAFLWKVLKCSKGYQAIPYFM